MKWFLGVLVVVSLSVWGVLEFVFPRPEGHWHLFGDILYEDFSDNYSLLEFDENEIILEEFIWGSLYRFQREMFIGGEGVFYKFQYHFSGDSLIL